ncbi:hypothetical protein A6R68_01727, partial [Neotoma lepida]
MCYQKQPTIFQNKKHVPLGETGKEKLPRYYKNICLGFKTPKEAIEGTYIDKKCPSTGQSLSGVVTKMKRIIITRQDYLHYIRTYNHFEKHHQEHVCASVPISGMYRWASEWNKNHIGNNTNQLGVCGKEIIGNKSSIGDFQVVEKHKMPNDFSKLEVNKL